MRRRSQEAASQVLFGYQLKGSFRAPGPAEPSERIQRRIKRRCLDQSKCTESDRNVPRTTRPTIGRSIQSAKASSRRSFGQRSTGARPAHASSRHFPRTPGRKTGPRLQRLRGRPEDPDAEPMPNPRLAYAWTEA